MSEDIIEDPIIEEEQPIMTHCYVVVDFPNIEEAIAKGDTDYDQPQFNRSIRYSLDGSKVLIEGLFSEEEMAWFETNGTVLGDTEQAQVYIQTNRAEWERESAEI